ncbi:unnamed protein product, partial [Laminaria digitata]
MPSKVTSSYCEGFSFIWCSHALLLPLFSGSLMCPSMMERPFVSFSAGNARSLGLGGIFQARLWRTLPHCACLRCRLIDQPFGCFIDDPLPLVQVLDINAVIYGLIYLFYEPNPEDP